MSDSKNTSFATEVAWMVGSIVAAYTISFVVANVVKKGIKLKTSKFSKVKS